MKTEHSRALAVTVGSALRRMTPADYVDAADLLEQCMAQMEIAYEEHSPRAKKWVQDRLRTIQRTADIRSEPNDPGQRRPAGRSL